ncbi:MAG: PAS domain S-box protein [Ignavibacteria bacterium]|nr:PAS domain S-box protein [Ignavibacteria bacterium]
MNQSLRPNPNFIFLIIGCILCGFTWNFYQTLLQQDFHTPFTSTLSFVCEVLLSITLLWYVYRNSHSDIHAGDLGTISDHNENLRTANHQLIQEITDFKKLSDSILTSEAKYRHALDDMIEGCQIIGFDWKYLYVNKSASIHGQRKEEELIGHTMMEMYPGIELTDMFEKLTCCMNERIPQSMENHFTFPNGTAGCFDLKIQPVSEGIFILSVDISARKQIEEQLRKSESMLVEVGKLATIGGWEIDLVTMEMFWTLQTFKIYDIDPTQMPSIEEAINFYAEEARPLITEAVNLGMKDGTPWDLEVPFITAKGKHIWVRSLGKGEFKDGKCVRLVGAFQDITSRKTAEEEIRESHAQFRMISENIADMIAVLDVDGRRIYNSPSYKSLFGNPDALLCTDPFEEIHHEDREHIRKLFQETANTGIGHRADYRIELHDGTIRFIESQGSVIRDESGKIIQVIVVSRDTTEKKLLEMQFLRAQRMESIGTLASGIAHDLNNVLAPILLSVNFLSTKFVDEQSKKMLHMLEASTKRGSELIKQVLSFARGVEGEFTIVQVRHLIEEIGKIITQTFPKSISFHTKFTTNLPSISADSTQIHQVLMNLCVNARDAMPNGGRIDIEADTIELDEQYVRMHIEAKIGTYIMIKVSDQGMGIPPVVLERIFEPFYTTKEINKGTGLGLSTVLTIIKSHKGFINVYSEIGKGTTFTIYLPVHEGHQPFQTMSHEKIADNKGESILLVEDEESIREITKLTLEARGYTVLTAIDGTEALATYAQLGSKISLVITDMMMPYMDGTATIRAIQKMNPDVKVIAVSGLKQDSDLVNQKSIVFLLKPYTSEKLLSIISELLYRE